MSEKCHREGKVRLPRVSSLSSHRERIISLFREENENIQGKKGEDRNQGLINLFKKKSLKIIFWGLHGREATVDKTQCVHKHSLSRLDKLDG